MLESHALVSELDYINYYVFQEILNYYVFSYNRKKHLFLLMDQPSNARVFYFDFLTFREETCISFLFLFLYYFGLAFGLFPLLYIPFILLYTVKCGNICSKLHAHIFLMHMNNFSQTYKIFQTYLKHVFFSKSMNISICMQKHLLHIT